MTRHKTKHATCINEKMNNEYDIDQFSYNILNKIEQTQDVLGIDQHVDDHVISENCFPMQRQI